MQMIILSAGKGERLWPLTKNTPKMLIQLGNGNTVLDEQIESIMGSEIADNITYVVGYCADQVEAKLMYYRSLGTVEISTIYNPFYDISNNLISLWLAIPRMDQDFVITNGDNLFNAIIYKQLIEGNSENGIYLTINKKDSYDDDDMKVTICSGLVKHVSKNIQSNVSGESVGLVLVKGKEYRDVFQKTLDSLVRNRSNQNVFWLEVFNELAKNGVSIIPFEIDGNKTWQEIDIHLDVKKAMELIGSRRIEFRG